MSDNPPHRFSWFFVLFMLVKSSSSVAHAAPIDLNPIPDPWTAVKNIIKGFVNDILKGVAGLIDKFNWLVFSSPAPGNPQKPATWAAYPWDGIFYARWWNSVFEMYWGLAGVGTIALAAMAVFHWSNRSTITGAQINHHDRTGEALKAFVLVAFGWVLLAVYVHFMNTLTVGIAPDGAAFVKSAGNFTRFGIGFVLGAFLLAVDAVLVLVGLLVLVIQWVLMLIVYALFPAAVIGRLSGSNYARVGSDAVISLLIGIPILKFFQAFVLRFVFSLPFGVEIGAIMTILATLAGVGIAFLAIPIKGTEMILPNSVIATGGSIRSRGGGMGSSKDKQIAAAVSQRSPQVASQVRVGPDSAAKRKQPNSERTIRGSDSQPSGSNSSLPALSDRSTRLPTVPDAERGEVSTAPPVGAPQSETNGTPSVTVNTAVNTDNTAMATAEASASSESNDSNTGMHHGHRSHRSPRMGKSPKYRPSLYRPLRRAKRKVENRRRKNDD